MVGRPSACSGMAMVMGKRVPLTAFRWMDEGPVVVVVTGGTHLRRRPAGVIEASPLAGRKAINPAAVLPCRSVHLGVPFVRKTITTFARVDAAPDSRDGGTTCAGRSPLAYLAG